MEQFGSLKVWNYIFTSISQRLLKFILSSCSLGLRDLFGGENFDLVSLTYSVHANIACKIWRRVIYVQYLVETINEYDVLS